MLKNKLNKNKQNVLNNTSEHDTHEKKMARPETETIPANIITEKIKLQVAELETTQNKENKNITFNNNQTITLLDIMSEIKYLSDKVDNMFIILENITKN